MDTYCLNLFCHGISCFLHRCVLYKKALGRGQEGKPSIETLLATDKVLIAFLPGRVLADFVFSE